MPQTDTLTAPDAAKTARNDKPSGNGGKPGQSDPAREALVEAAQIVLRQNLPAVAKSIEQELDDMLVKLVKGSDPKSSDDPCSLPSDKQNPQIPGFCFTREAALDLADHTYDDSVYNAGTTMETAKGAWTRALSQYDFAMKSAHTALQQAVATAVAAYDVKNNQDSSSRQNYLYFTMKQQIAAGLLTFEGSAASAGSTLAGALGTLLASYQSYLAAIQAAASQRLDDRATAHATFWQSVEGVLDS